MDYKKTIYKVRNKNIVIIEKDTDKNKKTPSEITKVNTPLSSKWDFYCHSLKSNDWSIKGVCNRKPINVNIIGEIKYMHQNIINIFKKKCGTHKQSII